MSGATTTPQVGAISRGRRAVARARLDFWLDAVVLAGYTIDYSYGFTGA